MILVTIAQLVASTNRFSDDPPSLLLLFITADFADSYFRECNLKNCEIKTLKNFFNLTVKQYFWVNN